VKLRAFWDRRVISSKCSALKHYKQAGIFIAPDEPPFVSWSKVTDDHLLNYQTLLNQALHNIHLPVDTFLRKNMSCSNTLHFQQINKYAVALTDACLSAAEAARPHTCYRKDGGCIAGWSEHVQPLREMTLFWHKMWLDYDRPRERAGAVADSMRRTRAAYHYAIHNVKRNEDDGHSGLSSDHIINASDLFFY